MSDFDIAREGDGTRGRYVIRLNGEEAELTYSATSPGVIAANHTGVPDAFRRTGAGAALVKRLVADALAEGVKILPRCSFVAAQQRRHPEWAAAFQ